MSFTNSVAGIGFVRPELAPFAEWIFRMHWIVPHSQEIAAPLGFSMYEFAMLRERICITKLSVCCKSSVVVNDAFVAAGPIPLATLLLAEGIVIHMFNPVCSTVWKRAAQDERKTNFLLESFAHSRRRYLVDIQKFNVQDFYLY